MSDTHHPLEPGLAASRPDPIAARDDAAPDIERTDRFCPKFDAAGLIPAIATDARTGELLMQAYMNRDALRKTIETGDAWYWSRSRGALWRKGATSGHTQRVVELRTDCDQDSIWLRVETRGGACHTGHATCFYRRLPVGRERLALAPDASTKLVPALSRPNPAPGDP